MLEINIQLHLLTRKKIGNNSDIYLWMLKNIETDEFYFLIDFAGTITYKKLLVLQNAHKNIPYYRHHLKQIPPTKYVYPEQYTIVAIDKIGHCQTVCLEHYPTYQHRLLLCVSGRVTKRKLQTIKVKNFKLLQQQLQIPPNLREFRYALAYTLSQRYKDARIGESYGRLASEVNKKCNGLLETAIKGHSPPLTNRKIDAILASDEVKVFTEILRYLIPNNYPSEDRIRDDIKLAITEGFIDDYVDEINITHAIQRRWRKKPSQSESYSTRLFYYWWINCKPFDKYIQYVIQYYINTDLVKPTDDECEFFVVSNILSPLAYMPVYKP